MRILVNPLAPVIAVRIELYLMTAVLQINFGIVVLITYQAAFLAYGLATEPAVEVVLHHAQEHGDGCLVERAELRAFNKDDVLGYNHFSNVLFGTTKIINIPNTRAAIGFYLAILFNGGVHSRAAPKMLHVLQRSHFNVSQGAALRWEHGNFIYSQTSDVVKQEHYKAFLAAAAARLLRLQT